MKSLSALAFFVLGLFVQIAFTRYKSAGRVWVDKLRDICHSLGAQWPMLAPPGTWHEGDHRRVLSHVASIPIVLKMDLRGQRDLRELKGLLSQKDIGRIQCAPNMTRHCIDVVKSYFHAALLHRENLVGGGNVKLGPRCIFIYKDFEDLEAANLSCRYFNGFGIAPSVLVLLRTMLGIWFIFVPFVLAEITGWFTILWLPVIGLGLFGMYAIAGEIQYPFGSDLNDFDLDSMANRVVQDVLDVQWKYKDGYASLLKNDELPSTPFMCGEDLEELATAKNKKLLNSRWRSLRLMWETVPIWMLFLSAAWSAIAAVVSWRVAIGWPLFNGKDRCAPWWCSAIAIEPSVKQYAGFALFLLLGSRLYDSHSRYVTALRIWRDGVIGFTRLMTSRIFESYHHGTWHEGDLERIAGHVAAFSIVTVYELRNKKPTNESLKKVLGSEDVGRILNAHERGTYCLDVVRGYLFDASFMDRKKHPCSFNIHWMMYKYLKVLRTRAVECKNVIRVPMPFGYIQHLRIFLVIWLLILPFGLVETSGWLTILWTVLIAFGVIGIERWSTKLSDPFGLDISDVPLDMLCQEAVDVIKTNIELYSGGTAGFVHPERQALQANAK